MPTPIGVLLPDGSLLALGASVALASIALTSCDESPPPTPSDRSPTSDQTAAPTPSATPPEEIVETYPALSESDSDSLLGRVRAPDYRGPPRADDEAMRQGIPEDHIVHPSVRGPMGPYRDAVLFTVAETPERAPNPVLYVAFRNERRWRAHHLGTLAGPWRVEEIRRIFFADAHGDGDTDIFVVGRYLTGVGANETTPFAATVPYVWEDGRFRYPNHLEDLLADSADVSEAVRVLQRADLLD